MVAMRQSVKARCSGAGVGHTDPRVKPARLAAACLAAVWAAMVATAAVHAQAPAPSAPAPNAAAPNAAAPAAALPATGEAVAGPQPGQLELEHSHVYIRVGKARIGHEHAVMGKLKSGELHLSAADNPRQNPGKLVFDMRTFDADSDAARKYIGMGDSIDDATRRQVNANMLGKEVLDVQNFPTATFAVLKITHLEQASPRGLPQYDIAGDFTLHGTTRPIHFTVDVEEIKGWLRIRGAFAILQTQYGIKPYSKMFGAIGVADRLDIYGDLIVAP